MQPRRRRRGTAMIEMILVLPLILLVAVLLVFFGRSTVRMQRTAMLARYEAWRSVGNAPGPRPGVAYVPPPDGNPGHPLLNHAFFKFTASAIHALPFPHLPADAARLARADAVVARPNPVTGAIDLAEGFLADADGRRAAGFAVEFPRLAPNFLPLDHPFRSAHLRVGHNWKAANGWTWADAIPSRNVPAGWVAAGGATSILPSVPGVFFADEDNALRAAAGQPLGNLVATVRGVYIHHPRYVGPDVARQW